MGLASPECKEDVSRHPSYSERHLSCTLNKRPRRLVIGGNQQELQAGKSKVTSKFEFLSLAFSGTIIE